MQLKQLLSSVGLKRVEGDLEREVTGLAYDSRRVSAGKVFVACRGLTTDGHDYISEAIDRGAVAIVCERNGFASHKATKVVVDDSRAVLAQLAAEFYGHPSRNLKVIGITGTNGKTTTTFILKHLLEAHGIKTGLVSTVHYEVGGRVLPAHHTTPESLDLQHLMAEMVRADCGACVMEVSSHALMQNRVDCVEFDIGVFTNLTQDHLDYHHTMDEYFEAKRRFFTMLEASPKTTRVVANGDDEYGRRVVAATAADETVSFGILGDTSLVAGNIELEREGMHFTTAAGDRTMAIESGLIGRHNVYNILAALGVAEAMDLPVEKTIEALAKTPPVPGRLECLDMGQGFNVIVDYAHTEDALENVLTTLREITPGRILLTFGCGGNRDAGKRTKMGEVAARLADYTVVTSDNPRKEPPAAIAAQIEAGYRGERSEGSRTILDRHSAIGNVIQKARPGDTVLIAGKGHETFQELHDAVIPFDDRRHAAEILQDIMGGGRKILQAA
jgi:UDP-N-acetylmuramoyl-L-alanyl-D-glutamate--2,6-diaminopimelate ligase